MRHALTALLLFAVLALQAAPAAAAGPSTAELQKAYDAALADSPDTHVAGLAVLGADCEAAQPGRFSCQIGFSLPTETTGRVYLDAVLVETKSEGGYRLISGLCRRG